MEKEELKTAIIAKLEAVQGKDTIVDAVLNYGDVTRKGIAIDRVAARLKTRLTHQPHKSFDKMTAREIANEVLDALREILDPSPAARR